LCEFCRLGHVPVMGRARVALTGLAAALICNVLVFGVAVKAFGQGAPAWAKALGPGVIVEAPAPDTVGHGSPGAAVLGVLAGLESHSVSGVCAYVQPVAQSSCRGLLNFPGMTWPTAARIHIGYVAIDGNRALVDATGTSCSPHETPRCLTNKNPAALLDSGKTFGALWTATLASGFSLSQKHVYSLGPCVKVRSKWYMWDF